MKKVLLLFILAFVALGAAAQSQKVKVTSAAEGDLPFSYIYINSKIFGEADKNAQVMIPRTQLKDGDTISATHIGFNKGHIIYKGHKSDGYVINMTADDLEKITVYGRKETRQEFLEIEPKPQFISAARNYTFRVVLDINGKEYLRGNFHSLGYYYPGCFKLVYLELDNKYISLLADDSQRYFIREFAMDLFLEIFLSTINNIKTDGMDIEKSAIKLRKTSENGDIRTFLQTREIDLKNQDIEKADVFFDVNTVSKMVVGSRINIRYRIGELRLSASYSYGKQSFLIDGFYSKQDVRYPEVVEATYTMRDGTVYTVDIYDTRLTHKDKPRKFSKENSVWIYPDEYESLRKGLLKAEQEGWPWEEWLENKE